MICYELCIFFLLDNIFDLRTRKDQVLEVVPVGRWFYFQKQFLLKNEWGFFVRKVWLSW